MKQAISVTKFNNYIKQIFDSEELLHNISIVGEVFGVSISRNVIYFSLKDDTSSLACVCFYPNLINQLQEGNKVIVTGSPNYYIKAGKLNFNVNQVEKTGQGELYENFLKLKQKLEEEGLFDNNKKKAFPKEIKRIGVITSREGAVIQDIKNVAWRRNPSIDIVLYNTKVQGNLADQEIAKGIEIMGKYDKIDVIVVARGGGSLEDLSAYNTELVARAAFDCPKFLVSAVGHETDYTIIDFVSDFRAPTPSAAAEILTKDLNQTKFNFNIVINNLIKAYSNFIKNKKNILRTNSSKLLTLTDKNILTAKAKLINNSNLFVNTFERFLNCKYYDLGLNEVKLNKNNPVEILNRGFAKIEQNKESIKSIKNIDFNKELSIIFKDGNITAKPIKKEK